MNKSKRHILYKTNLSPVFRVISSLVFLLTLIGGAYAQEKTKRVSLSGKVGTSLELYKMSSNDTNILDRRIPLNYRVYANANIQVGKYFSMPFSLSMGKTHNSFLYPVPQYVTALQFVSNPLNGVGIAPKYKWVELLLGSQTLNYSDLSVGDVPIFGAGINLSPGKFRFSVFAGNSQFAVGQDTSNGIEGIYSRKIYTAKIGVGEEENSHLYLVTSLMHDDTNSITSRPININPENGLSSSVVYRIKLNKKSFMSGEIAGSAFTRNSYSKELSNEETKFLKPVFTSKESSRMDYASIFKIGRKGKVISFDITGKYYGDGFKSMGYQFLQSDRMEATINPRLNLFKSKLNVGGSFGKRVNNLSDTRGEKTTQTLLSGNLFVQMSKSFSISGDFANFGMKNTQVNDTFKIEMVTNSWSVSPNLTLMRNMGMHMFNISFSKNEFTDYNLVNGVLNNNDAITSTFSYSLALKKKPLIVSTILSHFENESSIGNITSSSAGLTLGYAFFKKKIRVSTGLNYSQNTINTGAPGTKIATNIGLRYKLKKKTQIGVKGSINLYKYGSERPGTQFQENLFKTFINYQF